MGSAMDPQQTSQSRPQSANILYKNNHLTRKDPILPTSMKPFSSNF